LIIMKRRKEKEGRVERMIEKNMLEEKMEEWSKWVEKVIVGSLVRGGYLLVKIYDEGNRKGKRIELLKIRGIMMRG